jgi:hypothetical protein
MPDDGAADLGRQFAAANAEAIAFAGSCSEAQWRTLVPGEGWSVGVVLHHIAESHAAVLRWLDAMVRGDGVTDTVDDIDTRNEEHAERTMGIGIAETIELLRENGAQTEAVLRSLTEAQLARTAPFGPAGGQSLPVSALAEVTARHTLEHLSHARQAVEATS